MVGTLQFDKQFLVFRFLYILSSSFLRHSIEMSFNLFDTFYLKNSFLFPWFLQLKKTFKLFSAHHTKHPWGKNHFKIKYTPPVKWSSESIFKFGLSVCLFVSNKRQNGWTDQAQIFSGISRDPREGLWMIKFSKICLHQNSIFENFENLRFFFENPRIFFLLFVNKENPHVYKWNKRWARRALKA